MLIWQRSLKAYHCATGVSSADPGLIYKLVTIISSFGISILLSYVLGPILYEPNETQLASLDSSISDIVLIMRNMQETQVLRHSSSGKWLNFDDTEAMTEISVGSHLYSEVGETKVTIDVGMEVNEFELYLYLETNHTVTPQLLYHRRASAKPIRKIKYASKLDLIGTRNSQEVKPFTPTSHGYLWSPGPALKKHLSQSIKLEKKTSILRHVESAYAGENMFTLEVELDYSLVTIPRQATIFEDFYAFTVEYIYFAVFVFFIMNSIGDFLFERGSLKSQVKVQQ